MAQEDGARLKARLKAFERDFRNAHDRAPTKADIKAVPEIAELYKAYNRSKDAPPVPQATSVSQKASQRSEPPATAPLPGPPVTPPRREKKHATPAPVPSPSKLQALASKVAFAAPRTQEIQPRSPIKRAMAQHRDSPRSQARRWLGGAAGLTPEKPARKSASIFGTVEHESKARDADMDEGMDASPIKAGPGGHAFEPMFDDGEPAPKMAPLLGGRASSLNEAEAMPAAPLVRAVEKRPAPASGLGARPAKRAKTAPSAVQKAPARILSPAAMNGEDHAMAESKPIPRLFDESDEEVRAPIRKCRGGGGSDDSDIEDEPSVRIQRPSQDMSPAPAAHAHLSDDEGVHTDLARALNLDSPPARKHREAVMARKERLFAAVLQEPSASGTARLGRASGLEELAELNERGIGGSDVEADEEGSDDDWASECEGWKELGGDEMDGLDAFGSGDET